MPLKADKLKKRVAEAAKAAQKHHARLEREKRRHASLHDASARQTIPIVKSVTPKDARNLDGDAESGPGVVTRLRAFLSLRGFNTSGITSAQVHSAPTRTHRERRILASSAASNRHTAVQAPRLRTTPTPPTNSVQQPPKSKTKPRQKLTAPVARPPPSLRTLRRNRLLPKPEPVHLSLERDVRQAIIRLRQQLGLFERGSRLEDAVYVALDTEFNRYGTITEIGVSTLDTRNISDIVPDHRAANWISKVKHWHIVVDNRNTKLEPRESALFCQSQVESSKNARAFFLQHLQQCRQAGPSHSCRNVHLVGQSIANDVAMLKRCPKLQLDLSNASTADFQFDSVFDTSLLAKAARDNGTQLLSFRLGHLARKLGVDSRFHSGETVRGTHNASNDAAYTMMVMLLFAVRWNDLPSVLAKPERQLPAPPQQPLRETLKKRMKQHKLQARAQERKERKLLRKELDRQNVAAKVSKHEHNETGLLGKISMAAKRLFWNAWR